MKMNKIISVFLAVLMLVGSLAITIEAAWEDKVAENGSPLIDYMSHNYENSEAKLADMVLVRSQYGYELYFEEFTGEIALKDTLTGEVLFSNPIDINTPGQSIALQTKQKLLSQIILTYQEVGKDTIKTMNSYVEAALRGQITMKPIKGGIRVEYAIGEETTTRLVPRMISAERFENLILANIDDEWIKSKVKSYFVLQDPNDELLTERAVAVMKAKYPITEKFAIYTCNENIVARELRECEDYIKQYCPQYTYEEMDADHEQCGYSGTDAAPPRFKMALEYTLTEWGLDVRLPANGIQFDDTNYQLQTVSMLPYFGAGNNMNTGYAVLPDGSGALLRFEDFAGSAVNITGQLYGPDYAYHEISGQHSEQMTMPYYGVVTNHRAKDEQGNLIESDTNRDVGYLAIIEEGDSLASLMAECGGTVHPYNTVYPMFTPRPSDTYDLADSISVSGDATWTVTSKRKYTDSYKIRFVMLRDEKKAAEAGLSEGEFYPADWMGMATAYRDYLIDNGDLVRITDADENIPLYIESFGSIKTTERVLSFPTKVDTPLTTFEDIITMKEELKDVGVYNVNFKLTGFANGGLESTVPYKLSWVKALGGEEGYKKLLEYAAEEGFMVYPDFDFAYISNEGAFDGVSLKEHAVRTIDDRYTTRRSYDAAMQAFSKSTSLALSPAYYEYLYETFGENYKAYNNPAISVASLGTDLSSDFDEDEPYHREDNKNFTKELLAQIDADTESIMIDGGNAYAVKYADVILNASLTSSKYTKTSQSIPFLGVVYHGSKVIAGSATNMEGDIDQAILNAIENGATMYFVLSYQNTAQLKEDVNMSKYYSVAYDIWKEDMAGYYLTLNAATADLQDKFIVDHEFMDASRVPDADELAAEAAEYEALLDAAVAEEIESILSKQRDQRRNARLNGQPEPQFDPIDEDEIRASVDVDIDEEARAAKYETSLGTVVRVEYEGGVNFLLNYNSFDITVELDGTTYTIPALGFERIG